MRDEEEREDFRERAGGVVDPSLLVWVDECGIHTSMTCLYARSPKGERAYGSVPRNCGKKHTTLIASMTLEGGMGGAMAFEGSTKALYLRPTSSTSWHPR